MSLNLSGTDGLSDVDGTAATPAIRGTDANTGIFFPAADTIGFSEGGAECARFDSSGNFGLGVTPSAWTVYKVLQMNRGAFFSSGTNAFMGSNWFYDGADKYITSDYATFYRQTGGAHTWATAASGTAGNAITFTQAMTLDASGRLGIGTTTPANVLDVSGASGSLARFKSTGNYSTVIADNTSTTGGGAFAFYKQGGQIGIIGVDGAILGTTSTDVSFFAETGSSLKFYTNGSGTVRMTIGTGGTVTMGAYGAGTATFSAAGVISSVSDETWKIKDGVPIDPDSMLKKLSPGYWFYNDEKKESFGTDRQLGFYAQNVNSAIGPEAAPTPEEGKPWGYYDRSVLAVTVMSLQKALATIETLTARITALESA